MSAVFRLTGRKETIEVADSWSLAEDIPVIMAWLRDESNAARVRGSILDIGIASRLDRFATQFESIPLEFMVLLVDLKIRLDLSIYPISDDPVDS